MLTEKSESKDASFEEMLLSLKKVEIPPQPFFPEKRNSIVNNKSKNFNFPIKASSKSKKFRKKPKGNDNYIMQSGLNSFGLLIRS